MDKERLHISNSWKLANGQQCCTNQKKNYKEHNKSLRSQSPLEKCVPVAEQKNHKKISDIT